MRRKETCDILNWKKSISELLLLLLIINDGHHSFTSVSIMEFIWLHARKKTNQIESWNESIEMFMIRMFWKI